MSKMLTLQLQVIVPDDTLNIDVESKLNASLDEDIPIVNNWNDWLVGIVSVISEEPYLED